LGKANRFAAKPGACLKWTAGCDFSPLAREYCVVSRRHGCQQGAASYAAKVFINWFLSRRGQLVYQESHGDRDSLRVDIPKDKVPAGMRRVAGRNYFFVEGPEFIDVKPALKIVEDALAEKARPQ
jgi:hypothetical protein